MARTTRVELISWTLIASLLAAPAPSLATAAPGVQEGAPSTEVCRRLGFEARDEQVDAKSAGRMAYRARPAGMPPPPMTAAPSQELSVSAAGLSPRHRPAAADTERYPNATPNPVKRTAEAPVSTFSIDVDTAAYANARRFLNDGTRPPRDAVRVEEMINYFDYGYERPTTPTDPFRPFIAVTPSPWSEGRQILQIGLQGYEAPRAIQPPLNLVFLIDTSGSMMGEDRLPLARKALNVLIDQLGPKDRVSMVAYAGSAGTVLAPTSGQEKLKMRCAMTALSAGGSTAGGEGLALAYGLAQQNFDPKAVNRVILVTDGDFNVGIADPRKLTDFVAEKRKSGVYLSVYGFGRGNYNDTMMQALAQNGNGTAGYVDTLSEARKLFRDDVSASLFPIADDVKIQVEFNPKRVAEYRLIGYETRLLNREDFNNDQVDAGDVGSGASVTALYEITPSGARSSSDRLRYRERRVAETVMAGELAFLKVRYKLPGKPNSLILQRAITDEDAHARIEGAPEAARWALAVAAFGQKLRGDPWVADRFGWGEITALAQGARGADPDGLRAEFVQLTRAAEGARSVNE